MLLAWVPSLRFFKGPWFPGVVTLWGMRLKSVCLFPLLRENRPLMGLQWLGLEFLGCEDTLSSTHLGLPVAEGPELVTWQAPGLS